MKDTNMSSNDQSPAKLVRYDAAFKREAVRMWRSSGQPAEQTARALGISVFSLYEWGRSEGAGTRVAGDQRPQMSQEDPLAENQRLQRELARVTEQRDILKKAAGILSEPSPSGMPGSKR
jgi:transposase